MNFIKIDQAMELQLLQTSAKASLETLSMGDLVQGRVQSLENGLLLIRLLDGASFTAKVPNDFLTSMGELITLEIGELINDQLTARVVEQQAPVPETTAVIPTDYSLSEIIGQHLQYQGASPTENLITNVLALLETEPNIPIDQAAFLVSNKMEQVPGMVKILHKISENEFQLFNNLQDLKEGLISSLSQMDGEARTNILKPLIISQQLDILSAELDHILSKSQPQLKEAILENMKQLLAGNLSGEAVIGEENGRTRDLAESVLNQSNNASDMKKSTRSAEERGIETEEGANVEARTTKETDTLLPKRDSLETTQKPIEPQELGRLLRVLIKTLENNQPKLAVKSPIEHKELKEMLEKFFDRAVIKAENGKVQDIEIKDKTEALRELMDFSRKVISQLDQQSRDTILPVYKEIDLAFEFFNRVTTYDAMLQIPIKMNGENTTGELYVMKRKNNRKKLDGGNFTLFLSLQTSNLGHIESFLNASNKYVTISFRVEQKDLVTLVKDRHRDLYDGLLKKGYKLAEMKCRLLDHEKTNILDAAAKSPKFLGLQSKVDLKI